MNHSPLPAAAIRRPHRLALAVLWLLLLWSAVQIGGGLYEKRVVIPAWSGEVQPDRLARALEASGHTASGTRFWPFVSPVVFLLAIGNAVAAWRHRGPARGWWLGGALALVVMSIATYTYFVPSMLRWMDGSAGWSQEALSGQVSLWLTLSPLRMILGLAGWACCMRAAMLLPTSSVPAMRGPSASAVG